MITRFACLLLITFLVVVGETSAASPGKKPNILLITVDDMSRDSVGAFGAKLAGTTPHIDRLAAEGLRFEHAHVPTGACMPSRNAMFARISAVQQRIGAS